MTHIDYFVWGIIKHKCYTNKSETCSIAVKANIRDSIAEMQPLHSKKLKKTGCVFQNNIPFLIVAVV